jgi:hypothetical protein
LEFRSQLKKKRVYIIVIVLSIIRIDSPLDPRKRFRKSCLLLEQAAAFIIELRWSFDKYRERLRKLLAFGSRRSSEYLVKNLCEGAIERKRVSLEVAEQLTDPGHGTRIHSPGKERAHRDPASPNPNPNWPVNVAYNTLK